MSDPGETPFRYLLRVRYGEVDAQRVVFNARWADYVDVAVTEYHRALWSEPSPFEMHLVKLSIEWRAPARFDDVIEARVTTARIGTTSFTIATAMTRWPDGAALAASEAVYVAVDLDRGESGGGKMEIPPRFRDALVRGAPGVIVDHAGALR